MTDLPDFSSLTVRPGDILVLTTKGAVDAAVAAQIANTLPKNLHGRVVVVDGTTFDAQVVRA